MGTKLGNLALTPSVEMTNDCMRALIHGPQGSGKTYTSSSIAELGKTLFVDMVGEKGGRSFRGAPWEKNITVARPKSVTEMDDLFWDLAAGGHGFKAVVLDSLSAYCGMIDRYLLGHDETSVREIKKGNRAKRDWDTWGQMKDIVTETCTFWMGLADGEKANPMHVVFTCQSRDNGTDDDDGLHSRYLPDVTKGSRSAVLATPDYVLYTDVEEYLTDAGETDMRHIVRIGPSSKYSTKARIPASMHGKIPSILGRGTSPVTLGKLAKLLGCAPAA